MEEPRTRGLVEAARDGDRHALDELLTAHLPLVYNIVGRALDGHPDVDDIVQDTMLRVVRSIAELRDPDGFRSWLVAIAMHRIRDRARAARSRRTVPASALEREPADPEGDFAGLTVLRLGLEGQRREVAEATRWLDPEDRELLSLWWLEVAGSLSRPDLAEALGLTRQHTAVRVQRLKERLETARSLVRALDAQPRCAALAEATAEWDGRPGSVWRKRILRHLRGCPWCGGAAPDTVPAERLLAGLALVPIPVGFALHALAGLLGGGTTQAVAATAALGSGAAGAGAAGAGSGGQAVAADPVGLTAHLLQLLGKPAVAATAGLTLIAGGAYIVHDHQDPPRPPRAAAPSPEMSVSTAPATTPPAASPKPSRKPETSHKPKPKSKKPAPRYGSVVDKAEPAPDPSARPGPLPRRPETGLTSSAGPKAVMVHRGDTVTLRGCGYALVRWQILPGERAGALVMPTWTGLQGKLFHVASGGGRRMDDQMPTATDRPHTWMGSPATGFTVLPEGAQQMWQNEYYYVDGEVTLRQNERGADYNLIVQPTDRAAVTGDITQPPDPARGVVRYGYVRDTGTDAAPVPQYLNRAG
ncbi:RNA polymerase sigma factor [Streptomyces sp. NPDC056486]|uniref:RNA polymerase sigma factor n=1 Tax=Streptomyces sp. NPDC056486 TaxID=3345835 RepID=UPI0036BDA6EA